MQSPLELTGRTRPPNGAAIPRRPSLENLRCAMDIAFVCALTAGFQVAATVEQPPQFYVLFRCLMPALVALAITHAIMKDGRRFDDRCLKHTHNPTNSTQDWLSPQVTRVDEIGEISPGVPRTAHGSRSRPATSVRNSLGEATNDAANRK